MKVTGKTVVILALVLIILAESVVVWRGMVDLSTRPEQVAGPPDVTVEFPEQLNWRMLCPVNGNYFTLDSRNPGLIAMSCVGNFDEDPEEEICLPMEGGLAFFELDGEYRVIQVEHLADQLWHCYFPIAWDVDRDGIDELLPWSHPLNVSSDFKDDLMLAEQSRAATDGTGLQMVLPVMNTCGGVEALLPCSFSPNLPLVGDVDGDSWDELVICRSDSWDAIVALGRNGEEVWNQVIAVNEADISFSPFFCLGDFDDDGREEWFQILRGCWCFGYEQEPVEMPKIPQNYCYISGNLDRLGVDEIITGEWICYPESGGGRRLQYTADHYELHQLACGDYLSGGNLELCVGSSVITEEGNIHIFDAVGTMLYEENFSEPIYRVHTARGRDGDHLVLNTSQRILIYP